MPGDMMNTDWSYAVVWIVIMALIGWAVFGRDND